MIGSRLGHDHIVKVVDFAHTDDAFPYIVMELLEGEDLGQRLTREGRLPLEQAISITRQVGLALSAAHAEGVVHRDLKPDNIYLCTRQGGGILAKVMDFGISKVTSSDSIVTEQYSVLGTPAYMSPEQADGRVEEIDHRTDIYSLAVVLYHMLTGKVPFRGDKVSAILYQVVHNLPPPLHKVRQDLPPGLSEVVQRALQKRRVERYPSMEEFAAELERAMGDRWSSVLMQEVRASPGADLTGPAEGGQGLQTPSMGKSCEEVAYHSTVDSDELAPVDATALMRGVALEEPTDSDELSDTTAHASEIAFERTVDSDQLRSAGHEEEQEDTLRGHGPVTPPADEPPGESSAPEPPAVPLVHGAPTVLLTTPPKNSWVRLAVPAGLALIALAISALLLVSDNGQRSPQKKISHRATVTQKPGPAQSLRSRVTSPTKPKAPQAKTSPVQTTTTPDSGAAELVGPSATDRALSVTTRPPGARVLVGGQKRGTTPLVGEPVGRGALRVELHKRGYHREVRRVPAGSAPVRLGATLRPLPASLRVVAMHGTDSVKAVVFVDDKRKDQTPAVLTDMTPGRYRLRVSASGFRPWTHQVTLRPGERKRVVAVMKR